MTLTRRQFGRVAVAGAHAGLASLRAAGGWQSVDETLRAGRQRRGIPALAAMVANGHSVLYSGAFGTGDATSNAPLHVDSLFSIMSMTKAVTTTAALQLVEQGKLKLDEPAARLLPEFARLRVIAGFHESTGEPILRPPSKPVTLRLLLTHTSGFSYDTWNQMMFRYAQKTGTLNFESISDPPSPLVFEPGTAWQYGTSLDWTGRMIEAASGQGLEEYFQNNILQPLGMKDTSYFIPAEKFERLVSYYHRTPAGTYSPSPRVKPVPPVRPTGGGGLYSTAPDYIRFMQMILGRGTLRIENGGSVRILKPESVAQMSRNQIGSLGAGKMKSFDAEDSADVDLHPGAQDKWTFGFLMNPVAHIGGRSAGSLAWAGSKNTFFWIDPHRELAAVLFMQFLPFVDPAAVGMLGEFERTVYAAV